MNFFQLHLHTKVSVFLLCLFFIAAISAQPSKAQSSLSEISVAERSDGLGYVFRIHMSHIADSFKVFQPDKHLIQYIIYDERIDTSAIKLPEPQPPFDAVSLHPIPDGLGIDIYLEKGVSYIADSYPDKNNRDVLLALTEASEEDITVLTAEMEPIAWERLSLPENALASLNDASTLDNASPEPADPKGDSYYKLKDKLRFDRIVIDAGHGGKDPGAIGYRGTREKDVVLAVARKLGHYINENMPEVEVIYTREDDSFKGLIQRGTIANHAEGDLFVSLHCNSAASHRAHGTEVYFLGLHRSQSAFEVMKKENSVIRLEEDSEEKKQLTEEDLVLYELANSGYMATSQDIAVRVEQQFDNRAQRHSRGVKQAGFMVLYHASMPAILVELGFISNPSEQRFLTSEYGQNIMASAIFRAIRNYKVDYDRQMKIKNTK